MPLRLRAVCVHPRARGQSARLVGRVGVLVLRNLLRADLKDLLPQRLGRLFDVLHGLADPRAGRLVSAGGLLDVVSDRVDQLP